MSTPCIEYGRLCFVEACFSDYNTYNSVINAFLATSVHPSTAILASGFQCQGHKIVLKLDLVSIRMVMTWPDILFAFHKTNTNFHKLCIAFVSYSLMYHMWLSSSKFQVIFYHYRIVWALWLLAQNRLLMRMHYLHLIFIYLRTIRTNRQCFTIIPILLTDSTLTSMWMARFVVGGIQSNCTLLSTFYLHKVYRKADGTSVTKA